MWLQLWISNALLYEIYPNIRAIAVSFSPARELRIRYYLDREPQEYDRDSIGYVTTTIISNTTSSEDICDLVEECEFSALPQNKLDPLDGFVYARCEDEV